MASPNDQLGGPGASSPADPLKSQVPQGGPGTWDDNPSTANNRSSKKRALRACVSCRDRKVRCDVVNGGVPCTNCRLDDVDCVLKASNRGKHNHARNRARSSLPSNATAPRGSSPPTAISTTTIAVGSGPSHGSVATRLLQERHGSRPLSRGDEGARYGDDEDESNNLHDQQESERIRTPPDAQFQPSRTVHEVRHDEQPQPRSSQEPVRRVTPAAQPVDPPTSDHLVALAYQGWTEQDAADTHASSSSMDDFSATTKTPRTDQSRSDLQYHLPSYITPCPSHLDEPDLDFLARKGCLTVPDEHLRDELIRIYVSVVYPTMPAIDLVDFLESITGSGGAGTVSLLLFQAIMFASVTFVDTQLLESSGFESKRAARKVFFDRVKHLYGLDYEADRLTLVQSLLLMSHWYDSDSHDKHTWYWMGLALTTAHVEGLHRDLEEPQHMTKKGRLRRRIWWSCVIRDRVLGLGIRRPCRIREDEFSVKQLRLDDFDILQPSSPVVARYTNMDPADRQRLATLCIDLSRLCVTIGRILLSQYTIASTPGRGSDYLQRAIVRPRTSQEQAHSFAQCDTDLQEWFQSLAPESSYMSGAAATQVEKSTIRLHKILLYMKYLTALGALHRPQVFDRGSDGIDEARKADSRRKLTEVAVAITKLAFDLQSSGQLRYAPTSSIPAFLSAALIHLLNTRSSDEETRNISIGRFYQCLGALHQLQTMYAAADQAVQIIDNMLENAGFMLPLLGNRGSMSHGGRSTMGDRVYASGGANRVAAENLRLSSDMRPSRDSRVYPSVATAVEDLNTPQEETIAAPIPGAGTTGVIPCGLDSRQLSAAPNMTSIWSGAAHLQSETIMPLPADLMAGIQLDLDAWYDVGGFVDPSLMDFEMGPNFWDSQDLPM